MNKFGEISLVTVFLATIACRVYAQQVPTSTPCSLSFYRYLYNLPGEQIRPNVPEGTYMFGKRVGPPPPPEGQASDFRPAVLRPAPSYEAPLYLPPPKEPSTTTLKPSTSAPVYIPPPPPPSPIYPAESANNVITVNGPPISDCDRPEHNHQTSVNSELLPPYNVQPSLPEYRPKPTIAVPQFTSSPQKHVAIDDNEIFGAGGQQVQVAVPSPQFIGYRPRPYSKSHEHENCEKPRPAPTTTTTTTTEAPTTPETVVETRQNEIVISPKHHDCEQKHPEQVPQESLGVPSTDYGVVPIQIQEQAPSAGYHYDVPSGQPFTYESAAASIANGYTYPKASPSFEYPRGYAAQRTVLFESDSSKSSGAEDGNLTILKV